MCIVPESPVNGNLSVSEDGETLTYTCDVGYNLIGDSIQQCGNDGSGWPGVSPNCSK